MNIHMYVQGRSQMVIGVTVVTGEGVVGKVPWCTQGAPGGVPERKRPRKAPERAKKDAACVLEPYGRMARGGHGLPKASPGPAMLCFRGGPPTGRTAYGCLLGYPTPYA
jgi:hypothetical protein